MLPDGAGDIGERARNEEIRALLGLVAGHGVAHGHEGLQMVVAANHGQLVVNAIQRVNQQLQGLGLHRQERVIAIDFGAGDAHRVANNANPMPNPAPAPGNVPNALNLGGIHGGGQVQNHGQEEEHDENVNEGA